MIPPDSQRRRATQTGAYPWHSAKAGARRCNRNQTAAMAACFMLLCLPYYMGLIWVRLPYTCSSSLLRLAAWTCRMRASHGFAALPSPSDTSFPERSRARNALPGAFGRKCRFSWRWRCLRHPRRLSGVRQQGQRLWHFDGKAVLQGISGFGDEPAFAALG